MNNGFNGQTVPSYINIKIYIHTKIIYTDIYWPDIKLFAVELWLWSLVVEWLACGWIIAEAVTVCPDECPIPWGTVLPLLLLLLLVWDSALRGGTAGAGVVAPFSLQLDVKPPPLPPLLPIVPVALALLLPFPPVPELFPGWLTCKRFRNVTNSVLKLLKRCWRCTASFDDDASDNKNKNK